MFRIRTSVISAVISISTLIGIGTWVFHVIENWTWAQSFYFSVTTLTTVGYGDINPSTDGSRIFTAIYILIGVGVVIAALTRIGSQYLSTQEHQLSDNITRRIHHNDVKKTKQ